MSLQNLHRSYRSNDVPSRRDLERGIRYVLQTHRLSPSRVRKLRGLSRSLTSWGNVQVWGSIRGYFR